MKKNLKKICALTLLGTSTLAMTGISEIIKPVADVYAHVSESANGIDVSPRIEIEGTAKNTAEVGSNYTLPNASLIGATESSVKVYHNSKEITVVALNGEGLDVSLESTTDKVVTTRKVAVNYIGEYTIKYSFTKNSIKYDAEATFRGEKPDATFVDVSDKLPITVPDEFVTATDKILLPIPTVENSNGDTVSVDLTAIVTAPNEAQTTWEYKKSSLETEWKLTGATGTTKHLDLSSVITNNKLAIGNYTIKYQAKIGTVLVAQSKAYSFNVDSSYEFSNDKFKYEFDKNVTSWELGKEDELPGVNATHNGTKINAYYEIKAVTYLENGSNVNALAQVSGTKFKPTKEGKYTISYTVKDYLNHTSTFENNLVITVADNEKPEIKVVEPYETNAETHVDAVHKLPTKTLNENIKIYPFWAEDLGTTAFADFKALTIEIQDRTDVDRPYIFKSTDKIPSTNDTFPVNKILVLSKTASYTLGANEVNTNVELETGKEYRVVYTAEDKAGNSVSKAFNFNVVSTLDYTEPTVKFNDIFQSRIEVGESITFGEPTFTDEIESGERLLKVVEYSLYNGTAYGDPIKLEIGSDAKYTIDSEMYGNANKVKIEAYATNNGGLTKRVSEEISIANRSDVAMPEIKAIGATPASAIQGDTITVPAISVEDDLIGFVKIQMKVQHIDGENITDVEASKVSQFSSGNIKYVTGAKFTAALSGTYRITYIVTDAANNQVVQYKTFSVAANPALTVKRFKNLPSTLTSADLELGSSLALPTAEIEKAEGQVAEYFVRQVSAPSGDAAELDNVKFTPNKEGEYKLQYVGVIGANQSEIDNIISALANDYETAMTTYEANVITSSVYSVDVKDSTKPTIYVESSIPASLKKNDISFTAIPLFSADDLGSGLDYDKSYVRLSSNNSSTITVYYKDIYTDSKMNNISLNREEEYTLTYYAVDKAGNATTQTYAIAVGDTTSPILSLEDEVLQTPAEVGKNLIIKTDKINVSDDKTTDIAVSDVVITVKNTDLGKTIDSLAETGDNKYVYKIAAAGNYEVTFKVTDDAGHTTTETKTFTISEEDNEGVDKTEVLGTILIVVSVLVLAGVIVYFVVSKKKTDKLYK